MSLMPSSFWLVLVLCLGLCSGLVLRSEATTQDHNAVLPGNLENPYIDSLEHNDAQVSEQHQGFQGVNRTEAIGQAYGNSFEECEYILCSLEVRKVLVVSDGKTIKGIQLGYEEDKFSGAYGDISGGQVKKWTVPKGERIVKLVTQQSYNLQFVTNKGTKSPIFGPKSTIHQVSEINIPKDCKMVGIYGLQILGNIIQIGLLYKPLLPYQMTH